MGLFCCFSSSAEGGTSNNNNKNPSQQKPAIPAPFAGTRTWEADASWSKFLAKSPTSHGSGSGAPPTSPTEFDLVKQYIHNLYPLPAATGTIEASGVWRQSAADGTPSRFGTPRLLVLDNDFTGIVYATASLIQFDPDTGTPTEQDMLQAIETIQARDTLVLTTLEQDGKCTRHAKMYIFAGDKVLTTMFRPDLIATNSDGQMPEPTVKYVHSEYAGGLAAQNDKMAEEELRKSRQAWREKTPKGQFRAWQFMIALRTLQEAMPGCTIWDEGTLQDCVGGEARMEDNAWKKVSSRVIVARWFKPPHAETEEEKEDDAHGADVWRVTMGGGETANEEEGKLGVSKLLKMKKDEDGKVKRTGGEIVAITVILATPLSDIWPKSGAYAKHAALRAAQNTALDLVRRWHKQGKTQRCMIRVCMGAEQIRVKFVGEPLEVAPISETEADSAATSMKGEKKKSENEDGQFLRDFFMHVRPDAQHNLFESEVQFQAVKQHMRQRMAEDPARFIAMAPRIAAASANAIMEMNFPGCDIGYNEELFPYPSESARNAVSPHMTFMVVARDPKLGKEKNNIVCVMNVVPLPGPATSNLLALQQKNWLESPEMKGAEGALLELLKRWYKEGRLADDCMAQVMMATDATIYRFVDGERFEDYPEERMAQFRFG